MNDRIAFARALCDEPERIGRAAVGEAVGGHAAEMWFAAKRLISWFGVPFATKRRVVMRH